MQHYRDVFLCINSKGNKALRVVDGRSTYIAENAAAQLAPGTVYIDIAIFDGPGGGRHLKGKPDTVGKDLRPLLKRFAPKKVAGGKISWRVLSFIKNEHNWHVYAYFREPVKPELRAKAAELLRSFRFIDKKSQPAETKVLRQLKGTDDRGTLRDAGQKVRGGKSTKRDELQHSHPLKPRHKKALDATFENLKESDFQLTTNDDNWLLFRSKQVNDNDIEWIERIEQQGDTFTITMNRAIWDGADYAKNITYHNVFGVNLGKLPAGKYTVKWMINTSSFATFDERRLPKVLKKSQSKSVVLSATFSVVAAKTNIEDIGHSGAARQKDPGSDPVVALNRLGIRVGITPSLGPGPMVIVPKDQAITGEMVRHLSKLKGLQIILSGSKQTNEQLRQLKKVNTIDSLTLYDTGVTDEGLALLKGMNNLHVLDLSQTHITNSGLSQLKGLSNLTSLSISDTLITDKGLRQLRALPALRSLSLGNLWNPSKGAFTDSGMQHLATMKQLEVLDLTGVPITDTGLKPLFSLTSLYFLSLTNTKVGDGGLKYLENMKKLHALHLGNTRIGDLGLWRLKGLRLGQISLNGTRVTDAGVKHLEGLNSITWLDLSNTGITDEALRSIQRLPNLDVLKLSGTKVTKEGVARLKSKLKIRLIVN